MISASDFDSRMNNFLGSIGLKYWKVCWIPSVMQVRGRIIPESYLIEIYDQNADDAFETFIHEVIEIKVRNSLRPYRIMVNKLIEGYQEIVDYEKDQFIESLISDFKLQDKGRT